MPFPYFKLQFDPVANPEAVILGPHVRFTLLTDQLIRMEYSLEDQFEDHPSQAFWYRNQPVPVFTAEQTVEAINIETEYLRLVYRISEDGFAPHTLSALVKSTGQTWYYGMSPRRGNNLMGTARTLDRATGQVNLEPGLMARSGWSVIDDSESLVFNDTGWLEARQNPNNLDLYLFGYGHDYPACLRDFSLVAGQAPLIPRWILGNWWSRYWQYSDAELLSLMGEFKARQAPLSVCIVDMDWHITKTGNLSTGWTGYTWNPELFPDPSAFIARLHELGLKTALNLHPAEGIWPHETQYRAFAEYMGINPDKGKPILFDSADPKFIQGYFELLHHPYEAQGVDFWWMDWQQGQRTKLAGLDPLWWLNHLHYYDLGRDGKKRPFIFSRWGGLGNHRYPIGFSGDTVIGWEALVNQPGFTATAANVGYGWWSHDIGGHMGGIENDELYVRWVQYGVFSPIFRFHCTSNRYHERRPWVRGPAVEQPAMAAMRLRHALIPYIYSMAWRHYTTSLPLVTPMYYTHPEDDAAYFAPGQYWFGSELIAAPFTAPANPETGLSRQVVWLPAGDWFDFFSGEHFQGGDWRSVYGTLTDTPVFARAGAIIPLSLETGWSDTRNPTALHLAIFPGADNRFELVEDDGETTDYLDGKYAVTTFTQAWLGDEMVITIHPARGDISAIPESRQYHLTLHGLAKPEQLLAKIGETDLNLDYDYDPAMDTLTLAPFTLSPKDEFTLTLKSADESLITQHDRRHEKLRKYLTAFRLNANIKAFIDQNWEAISTGRISADSTTSLNEAQRAVLQSLF